MQTLKALKKLELLAQRKASVYGRTLTDVQLSKLMQDLAKVHEERAQTLSSLLGEKCKMETEDENNET